MRLSSHTLPKRDNPEPRSASGLRLTLTGRSWKSITSQGGRGFGPLCSDDVTGSPVWKTLPQAHAGNVGETASHWSLQSLRLAQGEDGKRSGEKRALAQCDVLLCDVPCLEIYHTKKKKLNTDHHIHFSYFRIRDQICVEITPRRVFIFIFTLRSPRMCFSLKERVYVKLSERSQRDALFPPKREMG